MSQPQPSFAEFQQPDNAKSTWPGAQYLPGYLDASAQGGSRRALPGAGCGGRRFLHTDCPRRSPDERANALPRAALERARTTGTSPCDPTSTGAPCRHCRRSCANARARRSPATPASTMAPDICIVNWYRAASRMGLHQDKDESPASLERGAPVVSISIGDTAQFLFGGVAAPRSGRDASSSQSGDAFVFGGPARLRYHGVSRILPGTGAGGLAIRRPAESHVSTVLRRAPVVPTFGTCDRHMRSAHDS